MQGKMKYTMQKKKTKKKHSHTLVPARSKQ